jgi:hypothetical protein
MNFLLAISVPTIILIATLVAYQGIKRETGKYVHSLSESADSNTNTMKVLFVRKIVQFFGTSRTSEDIEELVDRIGGHGSHIEKGIEGIADDAAREIDDLDAYLVRINDISDNMSTIQALFSTLTGIIVVWGIMVSLTQYSVLAIYLFRPFNYVAQTNTIILSSMAPLVGAILIIVVQLSRRITRLKSYDPSESLA